MSLNLYTLAAQVMRQFGNRALSLNIDQIELLFRIASVETMDAASLYERYLHKQTVRSRLKALSQLKLIEQVPLANLGGNTHSNLYCCAEAGRQFLQSWPCPHRIPKLHALVNTVPILPRATAMNLMHLSMLEMIGQSKSAGLLTIDAANQFAPEPLSSVQRRAQYLAHHNWVVATVTAMTNKTGRSQRLQLSNRGRQLYFLIMD
jgi:hypothetical protein